MLVSLALIFILGMSLGWIFKQIKLPEIIGMLIVGIVLGPYVLDMLDDSILNISSELRQIALIIILIKAGLSLNIKDLKKVGRPAILLSFLPAIFEIAGMMILGPILFDINYIEAGLIGSILAAVSPAVVVPMMVKLIEKKRGTKEGIPQMLLAASSLDDVFVIVIFTIFLSLAKGEKFSLLTLGQIPLSIILGIILGVAVGLLVSLLFKKHHMRDTLKILVILGSAFIMSAIEVWLEDIVLVSGLLAVMSSAIVIQMMCPIKTERLSIRFSKIWVGAQIMLFVLVGAEVKIEYITKYGLNTVIIILIVLIIRLIGTYLSLIKTKFNSKERMFCIIAYIPKATVQAAIGAIPLTLGLKCGSLALTIAVLSIIITAPLGAIGMDLTYQKFLKKEGVENEEQFE